MNENKSLSGILTGGCVEAVGIVVVTGIAVYVFHRPECDNEGRGQEADGYRECSGKICVQLICSPSFLGMPCDLPRLRAKKQGSDVYGEQPIDNPVKFEAT